MPRTVKIEWKEYFVKFMPPISTPSSPDNDAIREIAKNTGKPEWKRWSYWLPIVLIIIGIIIDLLNK